VETYGCAKRLEHQRCYKRGFTPVDRSIYDNFCSGWVKDSMHSIPWLRMEAQPMRKVDDKSLYSGLIRLHILHHASEGSIYGIWISEELARHGYRLSAGTLYPILHGLDKRGYLSSHSERNGKCLRRIYEITPEGRKALQSARRRVRELFGEMFGMAPH